MIKKIKPYFISVIVALLVGLSSSLIIKDNIYIYDVISKPTLAPSSIVFPIVWTILYILMGISSALVYVKGGEESKKALCIYAIQLFVNFCFSILFFNLEAFFLSFIWIVILFVLIILMIYEFYKISPLAAFLQIPYLIWVTFAGYLTLMIYLLN